MLSASELKMGQEAPIAGLYLCWLTEGMLAKGLAEGQKQLINFIFIWPHNVFRF